MSGSSRRRFLKGSTGVFGAGLFAASQSSHAASESGKAITLAETGAHISYVNPEFACGDIRRYLNESHLNNYINGSLGEADVTYAIQAAHDQGRHESGARPFLPVGEWYISVPINPCQLGMYGESSLNCVIRCIACDAFLIKGDDDWRRPAVVFEKFGIDSNDGASCRNKWGFKFERSSPAKSGFTVRDVEIGIKGHFGGGFYLTDLWRTHIENIGMTHISCMVHIVGQVVQCTVRNVISNNDDAVPSSEISRYGVITERLVVPNDDPDKDDEELVCENVVFENCAYIRGDRGIQHLAGAHVEFINFDAETSYYGAWIEAECYMHGGVMACTKGVESWTGIKRSGARISGPHDGTVFDNVDINTLRVPSTTGRCYGFELGDESATAIHGVEIRSCRIRGHENTYADGIRGRNVREAIIENNVFRPGCFVGSAINIDGRRLFVNKNSSPGEQIALQDGNRGGNTGGEVRYNECGTLALTFADHSKWDIVNI